MIREILNCDVCGEKTRHMTTKKLGKNHRTRRTVKHCTQCNVRIITNMKLNKTYRK